MLTRVLYLYIAIGFTIPTTTTLAGVAPCTFPANGIDCAVSPHLIHPRDGQDDGSTTGSRIDFSWAPQSIDPCPGGGGGEDVEFGTDPSLQHVFFYASVPYAAYCRNVCPDFNCAGGQCCLSGVPIDGFPDDGNTWYCHVRGYDVTGGIHRTGPWSGTVRFVNEASGAPGVPLLETPGDDAVAGGQSVEFTWDLAPHGLDYFLELQSLTGLQMAAGWVGLTDGSNPSGPNRPLTGTSVRGFYDDGRQYQWRVKARTGRQEEGPATAWRIVKNGPSARPDPPYGLLAGPLDGGGCFSLGFVQSVGSFDFRVDLAFDPAFEQGVPDNLLGSTTVERRLLYEVQNTQLCLTPAEGHSVWIRAVGQNEFGDAASVPLQVTNPKGERCAHPEIGAGFGPQGVGLIEIDTCYDEEDQQYRLIGKARRTDRNPFDYDGELRSSPETQDTAGIYTRYWSTQDPPPLRYDLVVSTGDNETWGAFNDRLKQDAASAQVNAAMVYDFLHGALSVNGLGNDGDTMGNIVGQDTQFVNSTVTGNELPCPFADNAAWGFGELSYGIPGSHDWRTAGSLDIAAHEWGHAILETIAGVVGPRETGAFSEAFGDWTQAAVADYYHHGDPLIVGDDLGGGVVIRDMRNPSNPGSLNQPQPSNYINDPYWRETRGQPLDGCVPWVISCGPLDVGSNDQCYVHIDSGVPNKAFALLAEGGIQNGTTVLPTGIQTAYMIALNAVTGAYWSDSVSFPQFAKGMIDSAGQIFGVNSFQAQQVQNAWVAVGVMPGAAPTPGPTPHSFVPADCNGDGKTGINELILATTIALGRTQLSVCAKADVDENGVVSISDLIKAVKGALQQRAAHAAETALRSTAAGAVLAINDVSAFAAKRAEFDIALETSIPLAGLQFDLTNPTVVALAHCKLDRRLRSYLLYRAVLSPKSQRFIVLRFSTADAGITQGAVLHCKTRVAPLSPPGYYLFGVNFASAVDSNGANFSLLFRLGGIFVMPPPAAPSPLSVGGLITYTGGTQGVPDVDINPYGETPVPVSTDSTGAYVVEVVPGPVGIKPRKRGGLGGAISSLDAAWVLDYVAGARQFTPEQRLACDVSGDGSCSASDASLINQRVAGAIAAFPAALACDSDFVFLPDRDPGFNEYVVSPTFYDGHCQLGEIIFDPLLSAKTGANFHAVALGDVTQNWAPQ